MISWVAYLTPAGTIYLTCLFKYLITQKPVCRKKKLPYKVIAIGHSHQSVTYKVKGNVLLNTGNWRDEYTYSLHGKRFIPKQKSYAYVLHDEDDVKLKLIHIPSEQPEITFKEVREMLKKKKRQ